MSNLLIEQVASQRTWPRVGDIDDCWILSWLMCQIAVAPWLPWWDTTEARRFAGDPDDGRSDGNDTGVNDMVRGIRAATPALGALITPLRGSWDFAKLLPKVKTGQPFAAAVIGSSLPKVYTRVPHQVVLFHEPGVGLRLADPMAPDRSEPYRISTDAAKKALESFGGAGEVWGVLFPNRADAFKTHPLYVPTTAGTYTQAQLDGAVAKAVTEATVPLRTTIAAMKDLARRIIDG